MKNLVENYLSEVASYLESLPARRREEELREMRQHLLNAVTVNLEQGLTEDDAVAKALEQFGTVQAVGQDVVGVWRRKMHRRSVQVFWIVVLPCFLIVTIDCIREPEMAGLIPMMLAALGLSARSCFSPRYASAWWCYEIYSAELAQFRLNAVCYFIVGFLSYFAGVQFDTAVVLGMLLTIPAWLEWRQNKQNSIAKEDANTT